MSAPPAIRVAIIEDDEAVRSTLAEWIGGAGDFVLAGQYAHAESAIANLADVKPDVVLVDLNLGGQSGITCMRELKPKLPHAQFMVFTVFEDGDHIFDALTAGASGYLLKQMPRGELLDAIRQVHAGGAPMDSFIARKVVQWFQKKPAAKASPETLLSAREQEILRLLARGHTYKDMADRLGVSMGTMNTHIRRIYHKLQVSSRGEAVALFAPFPNNPRSKT